MKIKSRQYQTPEFDMSEPARPNKLCIHVFSSYSVLPQYKAHVLYYYTVHKNKVPD